MLKLKTAMAYVSGLTPSEKVIEKFKKTLF